MRKLYSLLAASLTAVSMTAQVSVDDIAGKYVLVGDQPQYYIEDHGFNPDNIIVLDKVGDKNFEIDNFYYDAQDYDGNHKTLPGTWYNTGEWSSYPTVQNIQFQWDNTDMYLYNPAGATDDTQWYFFSANSFRLLPKYDADKNVILYLWPNNKILFTYYTAVDENYNNSAVEFKNMGAWNAETNPEGSLHLQRLPQYTTVTKRGLVGDYVVSGKDADGNVVSYNVNISLDGTNYIMTGLFGQDNKLEFTWDDTDAGIRSNGVAEWAEDGSAEKLIESYAPNTKIYVSFTEDGNLSFDHDLYYYNAADGTELTLTGVTTAEVAYDPLDQFVGTYQFIGTDPTCADASYTPSETYTCYVTKVNGELHMTGFLGEVDNGNASYYTGTYDAVNQTVYFYCVDPTNGGYVADGDTWYYVYDFTLNVGRNEAGNLTLTRDGNFYFYAYGSDWLDTSYSSLSFERVSSDVPDPSEPITPDEPSYKDFAEQSGTALAYFSDYDGNGIGLEDFTVKYTRSGKTITLTDFMSTGKDLVVTLDEKDSYGNYPCHFTYGDGIEDGIYFYLFEDENKNIAYETETIDTFYLNGYSYYYDGTGWDWLTICYYSNRDSMYYYINIDFTDDATAISNVKTSASSARQYFDLTGRRIAQPTKGIFIEKVNGKSVKRIVK